MLREHERIFDIHDKGGSATGWFAGPLGNLSPIIYPGLQGAPTSTRTTSLNNADEVVGTGSTFFASVNFTRTNGFVEGAGISVPSSIAFDSKLLVQYLGNNDNGLIVGSYSDLTGNFGLIQVPASLFTNLPFASLKLALP